MNISQTPDIDAARQRVERLEIADRLYQALIAHDPNRVITLCDGEGPPALKELRVETFNACRADC